MRAPTFPSYIGIYERTNQPLESPTFMWRGGRMGLHDEQLGVVPVLRRMLLEVALYGYTGQEAKAFQYLLLREMWDVLTKYGYFWARPALPFGAMPPYLIAVNLEERAILLLRRERSRAVAPWTWNEPAAGDLTTPRLTELEAGATYRLDWPWRRHWFQLEAPPYVINVLDWAAVQ